MEGVRIQIFFEGKKGGGGLHGSEHPTLKSKGANLDYSIFFMLLFC